MKTLPKFPYLHNISREWHRMNGCISYNPFLANEDYRKWLSTLGFKVPVMNDCLEFPENYTDEDLVMFILKWS